MFGALFTESQSRIDKLQIAVICGLMIISVLFVYSATMVTESASALPLYNQLWFRQLIWFGAGAGAFVALCLVDYRVVSRWCPVIYSLSILSLIIVLIPGIGTAHGGARRWIDFGPFQCQPSEFAKIAFILAEASFLSRPAEELASPMAFAKAIGMMALPFLLTMKEPDLGSALVLIPTGFVMLFVAGAPKRYLVWLIAGGSVLASLFLVDVLFAPQGWWTIKMEDYQRKRLMVYFGADFASRNATPVEKARAYAEERQRSYQVRQALISVGTGGLTGKGWHQGNQTALGFLPPGAAHNDFIFSVIAEEKGFVGSITVLGLYGLLLFTGLRTAGQARDRLGKIMAAGVVALLFSHVFINI
ncbi:MAG TPA: FtsW/RodA/SpoVE family cell cycle protein, partial [Verrucomicrobiae bacterium]|nr:FtsW/RodA/SpoVE family cell cycle protein [Verrucomicrobiae bacterium]